MVFSKRRHSQLISKSSANTTPKKLLLNIRAINSKLLVSNISNSVCMLDLNFSSPFNFYLDNGPTTKPYVTGSLTEKGLTSHLIHTLVFQIPTVPLSVCPQTLSSGVEQPSQHKVHLRPMKVFIYIKYYDHLTKQPPVNQLKCMYV